MSQEGEFKKRIKDYVRGGMLNRDAAFKAIDEARKEFPMWQEETSDEFRGTLIVFDGDAVKAWFLKWFGNYSA